MERFWNIAYHKVNVCWAHWVAVEQLQQNTGWSVGWKRVCGWLKAVEPIFALLIRSELSTEVVIRLILWVLEIVLSIARRLPEVEYCVGDWLLRLQIHHLPVHQSNLSPRRWILNHTSTKFTERRSRRPKWA